MNTFHRNTALAAIGVLLLVVAVIAAYHHYEKDGVSATDSSVSRDYWTWRNPVTSKIVSLPKDWVKSGNTVYEDALLTLTHASGRSLVYLVQETPAVDISLPEYVSETGPSLQKQLGLDEFAVEDKRPSYYEARGAELFGEVVAHTRVRVWRQTGGGFWQVVIITDQDYGELDHKARGIADHLMKTTL